MYEPFFCVYRVQWFLIRVVFHRKTKMREIGLNNTPKTVHWSSLWTDFNTSLALIALQLCKDFDPLNDCIVMSLRFWKWNQIHVVLYLFKITHNGLVDIQSKLIISSIFLKKLMCLYMYTWYIRLYKCILVKKNNIISDTKYVVCGNMS